MATSKITLYRKCKINRTKNMIVDNLDSYLLTLESYTYEMQYQKTAFKLNLKLNLDQKYAQAITPMVKNRTLLFETSYNYVKIENTNTVPDTILYYFIDKINWKGTTCVELELTLDVLNTYRFDENQTAAYKIGSLSNQTHITREHKDRYKMTNTSSSPEACSVVDWYDEGIYPNLYKDFDDQLEDNLGLGNCYLIYRNKNNPSPDDYENPVETYVLFDEEISFQGGESSGVISPNMLEYGKVYKLTSFKQNINDTYQYFLYGVVDDDNNVSIPTVSQSIYDNESILSFVALYKLDENTLIYWKVHPEYTTGTTTLKNYVFDSFGQKTSYLRIYNWNIYPSTSSIPLTIPVQVKSLSNNSSTWAVSYLSYGAGTQHWRINSIKDLDRTDSKLIKVIKLPYRVFETEKFEDESYALPPNFIFSNDIEVDGVKINALKLFDASSQLKALIECDEAESVTAPLYEVNNLDNLSKEQIDNKYYLIFDKTQIKGDYEPKLLHSAFYFRKFVYDSFNYTIQYENIQAVASSSFSTIVSFGFLATQTINSKFLFDLLPNYRTKWNFVNTRSTSDFDYILNIARNNEMPLYNVAYINYVRTGFNYETKKNAQDIGVNWATFGIGAVASVIGGIVGGPAGVGTAIAGVSSMAVSLINNIKTSIQSEESLTQKQNLLKYQSSSVSGSDDIDLMEYYSANKLHYMGYKCSDEIKKLLLDLFYFTGYKSDRFSNDLHINSRAWFNFIQADLVFDNVTLGTPKECLDELIAQYKNGVTYFHMNNIDSTQTWDFEQTKENAETFVYDN